MAVTTDIAAMYRRPRPIVARLLNMGPREDRALVFLMLFCALAFVAQMPRLSREAHLGGAELNMLLGGALLGWVFIAPLLFYGLAALSHLVAKIFGGAGDWYGARVVLFWALLSSAPLMLLHGLVAGFIGPGPAQTLVGVLWLAVLGWFWFTGLSLAERRET
ncbi:MAG: YIP1 family protein [Rhodobacteraceae bacterium]|nr:YIP1 family protein [Paracoccaceae bacterium]